MHFLPWVRRGLAAELAEVDTGASLPARASFPVRVTVNGQHAAVDIDTYGPGDVTGLDTTAISRHAPRRFATNVAPDEFAVAEFAEPDLPWMFTPGAAGPDQHLRPWLVLVVVTDTDGVTIGVDQARPLPTLTISAPAVPADELPDLSQSWAWAHVQVVTATLASSATAALDGSAGQRLSRVLCPRRLRGDTRYIAALVPAFDLGVDAGLGRPNTAAEVGPAWTLSALGDTITLPVYYHWEFTTGPAGDFESLARLLTPTEVPSGVGESPMFIGDAHPALPALDAAVGGVVSMEGALRAPLSGAGTELDARHTAWVDALTSVVDATADAASGGTAADAEAVAPPIYGQWHVNVHQVPARNNRPRWLRDLNADPRHRAAAGLGAEVVKANQEEYVDAAWKQVGDVLAANRLLDLSRAIAAITDRLHVRHVVGLDPIRALGFADRAQFRLPFEGRSLGHVIHDSVTLPGFAGRSFRRMGSPRSGLLRQAERRGGSALPLGASADIAGFTRVPTGELAVDMDRLPDGVRTTTVHDAATDFVASGALDLDAVLVNTLVTRVTTMVDDLAGVTLPPIRVRTDLATTGVMTDAHLSRMREAAALGDDVISRVIAIREHTDIGRGAPGALVGVLSGPTGVVPVFLGGDGRIVATSGRIAVDLTTPIAGPAVTTRPIAGRATPVIAMPSLGGAPTVVGRPTRIVGPVLSAAVTTATLSTEVTRAGLDRVVATGTVDLTDLTPVLGGAGSNVTVIPPVDTDGATFERFVNGFQMLDKAYRTIEQLVPIPRVPPPLDAAAARDAIVATSRPRPMIEARLSTRIRAADVAFTVETIGVGRITVTQDTPVAPIMVGPVLDRPLYLDLAAFDPNRFLPGAGRIPDNVITLLETNPRFVESFMVGANHEFNRELLWRRYPTDRRGTAFRKFWDRVDDGDDIEPIHVWPGASRLGANSGGDTDGSIVLLVRGQLLRRYPNTVVYAVAATADHRIDPAATAIAPVFAGLLDPDIAFVGFDMDVDAAKAGTGTMFVLQEQPAEPRFGLDVPTTPTAIGVPGTWAGLTWDHVGNAPGSFLDVTVLPAGSERPLSDTAPATARFGSDAGHMAAITFQRPFRAAVHSSEVLP